MAYREKYTITTTVSMACEDPTTCYNQEVLGKVFSELLLPEYEQEKFAVAVMNNKLELLGTKVLFIGLTSCVHVDKAILARYVLSFPGATRFAVAHNHPSGNTSPSNADVSLTEELRKVADLLGLKIVDHVIVANGAQPYSFSENGSQSVRYC